MTFKDLNIAEPLLKALEEKNYHVPTDVQKQAIPPVLQRKDVLACAQTGTGKTAAFALPIVQLIHKIERNQKSKPLIRSLIITPTRELAIQIGENVTAYSKYTVVRHAVIYGGVNQKPQVDKLKRGVHMLIATPGRLLDLISQGYISLDSVKILVLDEADRMLDMGFINDIRKILKLVPEKRQTLFFSATMPSNIVELSRSILKQPKRIDVTPVSTTAETVKQYLYYTNRSNKRDLLLHILKDQDMDQVLLFSRTKHGADKLVKHLRNRNISAEAIHGNKSQPQRQRALKQFKIGKIRVLVATDIAARGIDIDQLNYVINYDTPNLPETYVHRIGRTGRAGLNGTAISLSEPEENAYVRDIERLIKQKIELISDHPYPQTDKPMTNQEKSDWNKEKSRRKQEFFSKRKNSRNNRTKNSTARKTGRSRSYAS